MRSSNDQPTVESAQTTPSAARPTRRSTRTTRINKRRFFARRAGFSNDTVAPATAASTTAATLPTNTAPTTGTPASTPATPPNTTPADAPLSFFTISAFLTKKLWTKTRDFFTWRKIGILALMLGGANWFAPEIMTLLSPVAKIGAAIVANPVHFLLGVSLFSSFIAMVVGFAIAVVYGSSLLINRLLDFDKYPKLTITTYLFTTISACYLGVVYGTVPAIKALANFHVGVESFIIANPLLSAVVFSGIATIGLVWAGNKVVKYLKNKLIDATQEVNDAVEKPSTTTRLKRLMREPTVAPAAKPTAIPRSAKTLDELIRSIDIGGYQPQIEQLIREVFYPYIESADSDAYGLGKTKGVLLYGPPGTGKTTIARGISKMFGKVTVINGPEIFGKWLGESEGKIRALFDEARAEWEECKKNGTKSQLHVIIIDEIDTLFPRRGEGGPSPGYGNQVRDNVVGQMLTMLDGVDSPQNVLVIGTSNRRDSLDPALLRAGRLEVQIGIGLPTVADRHAILVKRSAHLILHDLLDEGVDLMDWAIKTTNYSGAGLELLIKKASQLAMQENIQARRSAAAMEQGQGAALIRAKVSNVHLEKSRAEIDEVMALDQAVTTAVQRLQPAAPAVATDTASGACSGDRGEAKKAVDVVAFSP